MFAVVTVVGVTMVLLNKRKQKKGNVPDLGDEDEKKRINGSCAYRERLGAIGRAGTMYGYGLYLPFFLSKITFSLNSKYEIQENCSTD